MFANWSDDQFEKSKDHEDVNNLIEIITSIRSFKNELGVSPGSFVDISIKNCSKEIITFFKDNSDVLKKIGRIKNILNEEEKNLLQV